ncbi:hypothetical protein [Bradyrhizobium genosp. P]|uniref:hypothetical protein n=1 Tax=Bradyrhizobium genosp. P TaxID=83641 RepID=UPI003CE9E469
MAQKTPEELSADIAALLNSGDANTLSSMRAMLESFAELASLEADEEKAIRALRAKLRRQHKPLGVPTKQRRRA